MPAAVDELEAIDSVAAKIASAVYAAGVKLDDLELKRKGVGWRDAGGMTKVLFCELPGFFRRGEEKVRPTPVAPNPGRFPI